MNYTSVGCLPSLACPLIPSSRQGRKKSRCHPPYPHIDLNWDGFCIPHLRWIGYKTTEGWGKPTLNPLPWHVKLAIAHEFYHQVLAVDRFSKIRDHEARTLFALILKTFENSQERISVPLRHDLSRNELEEQWRYVVFLTRASRLIEEIYAVRSSLSLVLEDGLIEDDDQRRLLRRYKRAYGKFIPEYARIYNLFDFVAKRIGEMSANALIQTALGTFNPEGAFLEILFYVWDISPQEIDFIKNLSYQLAYQYFNTLLDEFDPDDSRYRRKFVRNEAACIMHVEQKSILSQYINDDLIKFVLEKSPTALFSEYSHYIYSLDKRGDSEKGEIDEKVEDGNFTILLESIMQQITQGKGLVCSFWTGTRHTCCGGRNRVFLEKVWKCTKPDRSKCKLWERMGCFARGACATGQRKRLKTSGAKA